MHLSAQPPLHWTPHQALQPSQRRLFSSLTIIPIEARVNTTLNKSLGSCFPPAPTKGRCRTILSQTSQGYEPVSLLRCGQAFYLPIAALSVDINKRVVIDIGFTLIEDVYHKHLH
jgi:hypothetical protein